MPRRGEHIRKPFASKRSLMCLICIKKIRQISPNELRPFTKKAVDCRAKQGVGYGRCFVLYLSPHYAHASQK